MEERELVYNFSACPCPTWIFFKFAYWMIIWDMTTKFIIVLLFMIISYYPSVCVLFFNPLMTFKKISCCHLELFMIICAYTQSLSPTHTITSYSLSFVFIHKECAVLKQINEWCFMLYYQLWLNNIKSTRCRKM